MPVPDQTSTKEYQPGGSLKYTHRVEVKDTHCHHNVVKSGRHPHNDIKHPQIASYDHKNQL